MLHRMCRPTSALTVFVRASEVANAVKSVLVLDVATLFPSMPL